MGKLCSFRLARSKEVARGFAGIERRPAPPMTVAKSAPTFIPSLRALIRMGIVRLLPLCEMKPWFVRELRPERGDRTSPGPGGGEEEELLSVIETS